MEQHLPFTVCAEECEAVEEQSDDESHTLQVAERSEGKTKAISNNTYSLRYLNASVANHTVAAIAIVLWGLFKLEIDLLVIVSLRRKALF